MPILVEWFNEDEAILCWRFENEWTWEDFFVATEQSVALTRSKAHIVDTIIDLSLANLIPQSIVARADLWARRPIISRGVFVVVSKNLMVRLFYATLSRTFYQELVEKGRMVLVQNHDQALDFISQKRHERKNSGIA